MDQSTTQTEAVRYLRLGPHRLAATRAFDSYWRFAHERQSLFLRRVAGETPPWTADPILAAHRFTNVYRASDRVSQYLIRHVSYAAEQTPEEIFFRTVLFKIFNRIGTWERLRESVGEISWRSYSFERYSYELDALFATGDPIYSAAYIMPSPPFGERRKHANHLRLIEHMMRDRAPQKIADARSLRAVFELLRGYPSLGDFLAFQLAIDLNYSAMISFSEMDFVVAGPGARDGMKKCFVDVDGLTQEALIQIVTEVADAEFKRLGLTFPSLWGRPLQLIDYQNVFCELSKYARVAHPEIEGIAGRTRIKQRYTPALTHIPQWYPPKWGINTAITKTVRVCLDSKHTAEGRQPSQQSFGDRFLNAIPVE